MDNLPELSCNQFIWNGKIGYTGSLIKRTIPSTLNIYTHYGLIYGFDKNGILWIIENNQNGVECVTIKDFLAGNSNYAIEPLADANKSLIILLRAFERSSLKYDKRYNNCDHFVNYALYGVAKSIQTEITENIASFTLSVTEISIYCSRNPRRKEILKMLNDFRQTLNLPKQSGTKNKSKYSSKKLKGK
jgi:hypothetical protein